VVGNVLTQCLICTVLLLCCAGGLRRGRVLSSAGHTSQICCPTAGRQPASACCRLNGSCWIIHLATYRYSDNQTPTVYWTISMLSLSAQLATMCFYDTRVKCFSITFQIVFKCFSSFYFYLLVSLLPTCTLYAVLVTVSKQMKCGGQWDVARCWHFNWGTYILACLTSPSCFICFVD